MHLIEGIGNGHEDAHHQHEKNHKLLEGHVGSQRHDGHAVTGEDVAGTNQKGVGCYSEQGFLLEDAGVVAGWAEEDDDESLEEEDLRGVGDTVA